MSNWKSLISKNIKELRFILCQQSKSSEGVRQFIQNHYSSIKELNPDFPFIVRECEKAEPNIMARYNFGVERYFFVPFCTEEEIEAVVKELVDQAYEINKSKPTFENF